jgi:DNA-binding HxlR family transcriptional regulator
MAKRKSLGNAECPVARSINLVGDRWSLLIVRNALEGMRRFSEFQKDLSLSKSILATRLRSLVANGILELVPGTDGSAYQEYELTEKGRDLFHVIVGLRQWGEDYLFNPGEKHSLMLDRKRGRPVRRLELPSEEGGLLDATSAVVKKVS